jgi:hypothetical protein
MKRLLASAALLVLLCHCGSSSGGGPNNDGGSGFTLTLNDFDNWCTVTVTPSESSYTAGTVVALHAVGNPTFTFAYWLGTDGANTGNNGQDPNASTMVTMTADKTVLACCNNATLKCPTSL